MTAIDQELVARTLACKSQMLRAFHEAAEADLAVAPLVIVADAPGIGVANLARSIAGSDVMNPDCFIQIRCAQMIESEFKPVTVLNGGNLEIREPRIAALGQKAGIETGSIVVLSDAAIAAHSTVVAALQLIASSAAGPVLVVLTDVGGRDAEDLMLARINDGLGLHKAHVPTARLSMDPSRPMPKQPVLLHGTMEESGCRTGERYMEIEIAEPYLHTVRFTVHAKPGQDDGDLVDALHPHLDRRDGCSVRLSDENGELCCGTDDVTYV